MVGMYFLALLHGNAQDTITKKTSENIQAKVLEISTTEVKYKRFDNQSGPTYILPIADVLFIRYENGSIDTFNFEIENESDTTLIQDEQLSGEETEADNYRKFEDIQLRGKRDAEENYIGQNSGAGWTTFITTFTSPLIGLIPAAACASTEPMDKNLNYPSAQLMQNYGYSTAYIKQAHKTKKRQVWSGYGIGTALWLMLIVVFYGT